MSENTNTLSIGQDVWWKDPEGKTSGSFLVLEIKYDEDGGLYDDTIVLISNGVSEAEVEACELQDLTLRRQKIKELVDRVTEIVEEDDWSIHNHDENFNNIDLYFSKSSSRGQDFGFYVDYDSGDVKGLINTIEAYYESYDPCEEAALWIGEDGHGRNGAPHDLADILDDMKECKKNVRSLIDLLNQELKGVKIPKQILHSRYSERLYNLRNEIIESIVHTVKDILQSTKTYTILWDRITGHENPDICYEKDSGPWNVLPDTIGLSDNEDEFFITLATYCEAPTSNNGENIYTDTLIDILEYLENYRDKL